MLLSQRRLKIKLAFKQSLVTKYLLLVCVAEGEEKQENVFFAQSFFIKLEILREPMELKHKHVYTFLCVSFSKV